MTLSGRGSGFGKTILIGDQFVLRGVPAIVAALPFATEATVESWQGAGFTIEDNRPEVPGYKAKKREQQRVQWIAEVLPCVWARIGCWLAVIRRPSKR